MRFIEIKNWTPGYLNVTPQHVTILAACVVCGSEREFDRCAVPVDAKHALIVDIEARLRCAACGARAGRLRFGSYAED
ncbi:hypothetical protein GGE68_002920 [Rhizobium leguminosarum]|uniref:hypothetical protein n=1 Tax=Rhizobium leguminosarum TaxID=384 RepID=UPI00160B3527|nr:hypothetical protein [Rhizobium leguminosarum]MBB5664723.1 hypothetical protein [Rhizobium leguminosarum]